MALLVQVQPHPPNIIRKNMRKDQGDPHKTKTGKTRLGPLNVAQLTEMLAQNNKPKLKPRIEKALAKRKLTQAVSKKTENITADAVAE